MSNAMQRIYPSSSIPGLLVPQVQQVPFEKYIGGKTNYGRLEDVAKYINVITNLNSESTVSQQWGRNSAKQTYTQGQIGASYYGIKAYIEYDIEECARFEAFTQGVSLQDFLLNLAKQGINQRRHEAILYGFDNDTTLNQGILANSVLETLPIDSNNKQTLLEYNPAELQQFLASVARNAMNATYGLNKPVVIASSLRVINYLKSIVVSLTESQKDGAGVDSIAGLYERIVGNWLGVGNIDFIADNTLEGDTKDKIVFVSPKIDKGNSEGEDSTNIVGQFNSIDFATWYDAGIGLIELPYPVAGGVHRVDYYFKMTPGATLIKEAVRVVEISYA